MKSAFPHLFWILLLCLSQPPGADAQSRRDALRTLAETGSLYGTGILAPDNRQEADEHMIGMAAPLQALYDLGGTSEVSPEVHAQIDTRSEALVGAVNTLVGFIDEISAPQEDEPLSVPEEDYDARSLRMVTLYLDLVDPLTRYINGDALDPEELASLRSGLMTLAALTVALRSAEF